jgi:hypothetical protein
MAVAAVVAIACGGSLAQADSLSVSLNVVIPDLISGPGLSCGAAGGASQSCTFNGTVQGAYAPAMVNGTETATASFGSLVFHNGIVTSGYQVGYLRSFTIAVNMSFSDTLEVGGYTGSGFLKIPVDTTGLFFDQNLITVNGSGFDAFVVGLVPFTAGQPVDLNATFFGTTQRDGTIENGNSTVSATMGPITVLDQNNNPISNYELISGSGTAYAAIGSVPEPGSVVLAGTAFIACAGIERRRRRRRVLLTHERENG